jgi:hypothetical protein
MSKTSKTDKQSYQAEAGVARFPRESGVAPASGSSPRKRSVTCKRLIACRGRLRLPGAAQPRQQPTFIRFSDHSRQPWLTTRVS